MTNNMPKEAEQKIAQLQMFEQSLQSYLSQKQQFQMQLMEVESALNELENANKAYKIVGNIMVEGNPKELKSEMESKKETVELRLRSLEKQETQVREKVTKLQSEIMKDMKQ